MDTGDWLTRGTVWAALTLYVASELACQRGSFAVRRSLSALGCLLFLAHVACAFHFHHRWSHALAYADTARQTAELVGWNSGVGLYINYIFGFAWIATVARNWTRPVIVWVFRGFFWFMIFNGAVLFAHGPIRGLGLLLCLALIVCWWPRGMRKCAPRKNALTG